MQHDRRITARIWFENATVEVALARDIAPRFPSRACFHAQQASEFGLMAALIVLADDHPRTHVADRLAAELVSLGETVPADVIAAANRLDLYYMGSRYPDALGGGDPVKILQEADALAAIGQAERVLAYCRAIVERPS